MLIAIFLYATVLLLFCQIIRSESSEARFLYAATSFVLLVALGQLVTLFYGWLPLMIVLRCPRCRVFRYPVYAVCLLIPLVHFSTGWWDYRVAQTLEEEYPAENLQTRLAYEVPHHVLQLHEYTPSAGDIEEQYIADVVEEIAGRYRRERSFRRESSLRTLHQAHNRTVVHFIQQAGFGVGRTVVDVPVRRRDIDLPEPKPIPFRLAPQIRSSEEEDEAGDLSDTLYPGSPINPFTKMHTRGIADFANAAGYGYTTEEMMNRGFQSHGFRDYPRVSPEMTADKAKWHVTKVELVSLLKHETPRIYLSDHLPMMEELVDAPTRPLKTWETLAIEQLQQGEELVTSRQTNTIHMLGAIRCLQDCRQCHLVRAGSLLGAFSYELRRVKPKSEPKTDRRISLLLSGE